MPIPVPDQWPAEVAEVYEPLRVLGKGGFASVVLARRKKNTSSNDDDKKDEDSLVAIKVAGSQKVTKQDVGYAHREIDILQELHHPNIMRVIQHWEPPPSAQLCAAVMALNYARGPSLQYLLESGGALNLVFCRVVAAQLVDAVAYCHSRAVMHRDIKPDNIIVTGAATLKTTSRAEQDEVWDNRSYKQYPEQNNVDWESLVKKWHVTLVDFGFARALTPGDMKKKFGVSEKKKAGKGMLDSSTGDFSQSSIGGSGSSDKLGRSMSRRLVRGLSALGNRNYAAPEVMNNVKKANKRNEENIWSSRHSAVDVTRTLSDHVAYYGLVVDAFSIGNNLRYMISGVPPNEDINEAIATQNHPLAKLGRFVSKKVAGGKSKSDQPTSKPRRVKYRSISGIPPEVVRLIKGMTHHNPQTRTSVRTARLYPWIDDVLVQSQSQQQPQDDDDDDDDHTNTRNVRYLSIVLGSKEGKEEKNDPAEAAATLEEEDACDV